MIPLRNDTRSPHFTGCEHCGRPRTNGTCRDCREKQREQEQMQDYYEEMEEQAEWDADGDEDPGEIAHAERFYQKYQSDKTEN